MRPRLLPILIATAVLTLTIRIGELGQAEGLPALAGTDLAMVEMAGGGAPEPLQSAAPIATASGKDTPGAGSEDIPPELLESTIVPQAGGAEETGEAAAGMSESGIEEMAKADGAKGGGMGTATGVEAVADPFSMTDAEIDLLQRLAERRAEIDREAEAIEERRVLLEAAESRVDRKLEELKALQTMIKELLDRHDEKEEEQLQSLVRIYESMKPKDAARIFEQLDMPVLLEVIGRMKERKTAPVLALMNPEKAKAVTLELANRQALPVPRD